MIALVVLLIFVGFLFNMVYIECAGAKDRVARKEIEALYGVVWGAYAKVNKNSAFVDFRLRDMGLKMELPDYSEDWEIVSEKDQDSGGKEKT